MIITLKQLELKGACDLDGFKKLFGNQVEVTEENCLLAIKKGLDLDWAAKTFFSAPAWEVYEEARAPVWEVCEKATAPAWEVYDKAREAYKKATAPAFYKASLLQDKQTQGKIPR